MAGAEACSRKFKMIMDSRVLGVVNIIIIITTIIVFSVQNRNISSLKVIKVRKARHI